jgi:hypothetical protein
VLDWTDTFAIALYFAVERKETEAMENEEGRPTLWAINPYELNENTWGPREILLPKDLGYDDEEKKYWDFGDLLVSPDKWEWDGPVAVYPIQINERVRAQRGWFTLHGNSRDPLEDQFPKLVSKVILSEDCVAEAREFLEQAGHNIFSIYPDYDSLAKLIKEESLIWIERVKARPSSDRGSATKNTHSRSRRLRTT